MYEETIARAEDASNLEDKLLGFIRQQTMHVCKDVPRGNDDVTGINLSSERVVNH